MQTVWSVIVHISSVVRDPGHQERLKLSQSSSLPTAVSGQNC